MARRPLGEKALSLPRASLKQRKKLTVGYIHRKKPWHNYQNRGCSLAGLGDQPQIAGSAGETRRRSVAPERTLSLPRPHCR
ncbi:hypothetical protein BwSH20_73870 [Bradyrhizobium ottawaense]|uniref:Uncharacterized protein n=1 Tax=Bradyrhizobium diazoefficiens TaxID=1355477 RepID=A0A810CLZ3_9BRAD|nr:hypothetical protein BD122_08416 [Bradyrhizobium diazoefficiens]BAL13432.1 hypothetical protein BJ6T_81870 [Bradyrhizobium japonicum USDA 6]BBO08454.1 hypothetical protein SG09_78040 [Bradyrhizobium ottawaense]BBZ91889.1 hypothetical protein F07S3_17220 [Bradyrhizobium diazoefficiens]BCA09874.1 hypothetical protein BDHF08_17210 [Bradyrhizobium diazoefficiens]